MKPPLAERLRPRKLEEFIGQQHLIGPDGMLVPMVKSGNLPSMILWGPPGTGKTTLAHILADETGRPFYKLSAINSGVKEVREVIQSARHHPGLFTPKNPILFIDEIHRFSKSQQDSLLEAVEKGWVTLIGATTENPSFEVIAALLSRCQVFTLKAFSKDDLKALLDRALKQDPELKAQKLEIKETAALIRHSSGDARRLLNLLELVAGSLNADENKITDAVVTQKIATRTVRYDKSGEQHYDIVSALIKSIRGSDPNAAVYWLARMVEGGEDVKFIARRLIISASEDIGLANPTALVIANAAFQAVNVIGYPEARIILSQCVIYLATSPKSNSAYVAIKDAQSEVRNSGDLEVPLHLRNAPTELMKDLGYGEAYKYAHDYGGNFVSQEYLPEEISGKSFYEPGKNMKEEKIGSLLSRLWGKKYSG